MKKLLLLMIALLAGVSGAWSFDVTVIESSVSENTYGSLSSGTFTTNGDSGLSGVTVSGVTLLKNTSFAYGSSLGFENVTSGTITLSAPEGYTILGYSLFARSNTWSVSYTLTPAAGGSAVTTSTSGVTLVASGVNSRTTTISYSAGSQNHFYIPSLVISIKSDEAENVNVVYKEVYDGEVKRTNDPVSQVVGEAPGLPSGLQTAGCTYKYYTTEACTGEELSVLTSSTTEVYAKVTFTAFTFSSDFDGATWYYVYFNRTAGKRYWQMDPNTTPYPDKSSKPSVSEALWAFTGNPYDGIKVMNARAGDGYYLKKTGTSSGAAITMQEGGDTWAIGTGDGGFTLKQDGTNVFMHDYSTQLAVWNSGSAANDPGSAIVVEAATPIKVTYKLTYNGNEVSSYTKDLYELVGATAAAPFDWVLPAYCSLGSCTPATITAETTEVTIPLNWNGPFVISSDYEHAVWYYMNVGGYWAANAESSEAVCPAFSDLEMKKEDRGLWAFVGNPFDGIECYNKEAGSTKKLNIDSNAKMVNSGYTLGRITRVDDKTFRIDNGGYYLTLVSGYVLGILSTQASGNAITVRSYYCQQLIDDINDWADDNHRDEYFGPSETSLTTLTGNVATLMSNMSKTTYDGFTIPDDILSEIVLKYPTTGYYRIKNNGTGDYLAYGTPTTSGGGARPAGLIATSNSTDAASVIYLNGSANTFKLSSQGLNIQSQTEANVAFPGTSSTGVDFVFTSAGKNGVVSITNAASAVAETSRDGSLHEGTEGWGVHGVVNWDASAANSKWTVEAAENITVSLSPIGDYTYATLGLPFGVTLPADVKAYILTVSGEWAIPTEISEVPAGTGVLLRGTSSSVTSATLTINDAASATTDGNKLVPTYVDITGARPAGEYILGNDATDGLGFYQRGSGRKIGANKAYLQLDADLAASSVKGLLLNFDIATGIDGLTPNLSLSKKGEEIFNLAGQRMSRVQKGVNIVNGKKVLVK